MTACPTRTLTTIGILWFVWPAGAGEPELVPYTSRWDVRLESLRPEQVLTKLDLSRPGLEGAKAAADQGRRLEALAALLEHYRAKYLLSEATNKGRQAKHPEADQTVRHVLQWGPYEPADYGPDVNWEWDPRGDIEWVAAIYRFYWAAPLAEAFADTRDEKYARAFVELTTDWIRKHPLEGRDRQHPVYGWRGFPWLDIQTGVRARQICSAFPILVHAKAYTPEFLGILLASLYDHQIKTEQVPMGMIHNKAVFENRGFIEVACTFPEFKDSRRWMELAVTRMRRDLLAQTTTDGVQREWSGGYHLGVLRDAEQLVERVSLAGMAVPQDLRDRITKMADYIFWMATPDLGFPMFGDCGRSLMQTTDRSTWPLYKPLVRATDWSRDPKYAGLARLDRSVLPAQPSHAFSDAGMYVMRSDWSPEQTWLALHCSPRGISGHDQPDNGTFELYANGRWLMTDTGFYTYGHDQKARNWHRQTRVHQTLTLDGRNAQIDGKHRLWHTSPTFDALVVENRSYPDLLHLRSVWFVDRKFFVLLDEALGSAKGVLDLHFQLAVGDARIDPAARCATTLFDDANVLVWIDPTLPITIEKEEGWFAWEYGHRKPRPAFAIRHQQPAPAAFLTILFPYRGSTPPTVSAALPANFVVGGDEVSIQVKSPDRTWHIGRSLGRGEAWCKPQ